MRRFLLIALAAVAIAGCSKKEPERPPADAYVYEPVRIASAYVALVEKPDAARALLIGEEAKRLAPVFDHAGVKTFTALDGRFDLIVVACGEMSAESCARVASHLSSSGVLAWIMDVRGATVGRFHAMMKAFSLESQHLWMPGENRWVLVGRKSSRQIKLSAMLDLFVREGAFEDLAKARCLSLPDIFAGYVGAREDVMPAFALLDMSADVRPENFVAREVKAIDWISTEGMDKDISTGVLAEMRSMQVVRRKVLSGNLLAFAAKDKAGEEKATETWAGAALRNPNDLFLLERLDRLDRNAKGFLAVGKLIQAMKCYETMVLVRPNDAMAVNNFGMCLKKIGKLDLAEKVLARAKRLSGETAAPAEAALPADAGAPEHSGKRYDTRELPRLPPSPSAGSAAANASDNKKR